MNSLALLSLITPNIYYGHFLGHLERLTLALLTLSVLAFLINKYSTKFQPR